MKQLVIIFISLSMYVNSYGQNIYNGKIAYMSNPCQATPCLPGIVYGLETATNNYILTINSNWIWSNSKLIVDDVEYFVDNDVKITGITTVKQDIHSNEYIELEILSIEKNTTAVKETAKTPVNIYTIKNTLTIESPEEQIIGVSLFDVTGKQIIDNQNLQTTAYQYQTENTGIAICIVALQSGKQITQKIIFK